MVYNKRSTLGRVCPGSQVGNLCRFCERFPPVGDMGRISQHHTLEYMGEAGEAKLYHQCVCGTIGCWWSGAVRFLWSWKDFSRVGEHSPMCSSLIFTPESCSIHPRTTPFVIVALWTAQWGGHLVGVCLVTKHFYIRDSRQDERCFHKRDLRLHMVVNPSWQHWPTHFLGL